jgi:hypothetical protein
MAPFFASIAAEQLNFQEGMTLKLNATRDISHKKLAQSHN